MEWNLFGKYLSPTDWWNFRLISKSTVPEKWTWDVLWNGPKVYDTYIASRFVHSLSIYSIEDVMGSITKMKVMRMCFVVLKWLGYNIIEVACRCSIDNLRIQRLLC